jgi:tetratricopeptide (TPR) repeat protein
VVLKGDEAVSVDSEIRRPLDCLCDIKDRIQNLKDDAEFRTNNPDPYFCLGMIYKDMQNFEEARDAFQKSIEIRKTPPAAWGLFQVCSELRDFFGMAKAQIALEDLGYSGITTSSSKSKGGENSVG